MGSIRVRALTARRNFTFSIRFFFTNDGLPHVLVAEFGEPVVALHDGAAHQEEVEDVDEEEAEGEVECVHEDFAEELDFEPQSVQLF